MKYMIKPLMAVCVLASLTACSTLGMGDDNQNYGSYEFGRSVPERISDESIELTARRNLNRVSGISPDTVRIAIDSFQREVLLTGEVADETTKKDVEKMIGSMKDVKQVYNYLTVTPTPKSQSHTLQEGYIKAKIGTKLLANTAIKSSQYKIVVRNQIAYVLGYMTAEQRDYIYDAVQNTAGMASVVGLMTIISQTDKAQDVAVGMSPSTPAPTPAAVVATPIQAAPSIVPNAQPTSGAYTMQEIYLPNASTNAPINASPVYAPSSGSSYIELYQGTNKP
ncbi:BON domain-containing protein [Moraxella nasovis]|uniref:BON domain-containing protein n=1 Tax=Moraxella nasovis TaxID=2904121 RepID=UPI001F615113|nr:BON domain-containing protein [Moraxella nasovis]UNU72676.1 BON domain-containing protein [Moraxella nasovis]